LFQPEAYAVALSLMVVSMLCWGSWANTIKLCPGYSFQLLYWDYVLGLIAGALLWGLTLGSLGQSGRPFLADLVHADASHVLLAIAGGFIFNIAISGGYRVGAGRWSNQQLCLIAEWECGPALWRNRAGHCRHRL
jgi:hypothetical protein